MERNLSFGKQNALKQSFWHYDCTFYKFDHNFWNWEKYWVKYEQLMLVAKNIHPKVNRQIATSNEVCSTNNFLSPLFPLYL